MICIARAPPIGDKGQGPDQCKLTWRQVFLLGCRVLTAREQEAMGHGSVFLNLTLHVPQTELKEKLSSCVSLVLTLGMNSVTQIRIVRG